MKMNKPWEDMNHPMKEFEFGEDCDGNPWSMSVNVGTYWGCRNTKDCDYEALCSEVPMPKDGLCLDCRNKLYNDTNIGVS